MLQRLAEMKQRYDAISAELAKPEVTSDPDALQRFGREQSDLYEPVAKYERYEAVEQELHDAQTMLEDGLDEEMRAFVRDETRRLEGERDAVLADLKELMRPRDPNDERNVIVEIRAGTGGEEASLFASELMRMYLRYAENRRWKTEVLNTNETDLGGIKEVTFEVRGKGAYSRLKWESGVHRVQRVPVTETGGRIHTSTATVAVMPEADEVEVKIDPNDLQIDVYRSGGHGGQSVNTTDSAVRITHKPSGLVVTCQDERSQLKNKARAMAVLRARLFEREQSRAQAETDELRRSQVGTGERSEKIRTYNFPQNRVTDHRIGVTLHNLPEVMQGAIEPLIDQLTLAAEREAEG
ncbi:MAG: peptide chain release factor 1 [Chloroflexi bacterium]|nr:peptide chain release factor 1 [Chloroflexota bacterium]